MPGCRHRRRHRRLRRLRDSAARTRVPGAADSRVTSAPARLVTPPRLLPAGPVLSERLAHGPDWRAAAVSPGVPKGFVMQPLSLTSGFLPLGPCTCFAFHLEALYFSPLSIYESHFPSHTSPNAILLHGSPLRTLHPPSKRNFSPRHLFKKHSVIPQLWTPRTDGRWRVLSSCPSGACGR